MPVSVGADGDLGTASLKKRCLGLSLETQGLFRWRAGEGEKTEEKENVCEGAEGRQSI